MTVTQSRRATVTPSSERRLTKKGQRTRQAIKTATRDLLSENGFGLTRVQDIAERAGLSVGGFYRYYRDKTEVTLELLYELLAEAFVVTRSSESATRTPGNAVGAGTLHYLEFYSRNADLFRVLVEMSQTHPEVEQLWAKFRRDTIQRLTTALNRGVDAGDFRGDVDTELAAELLTAMTDHYAYLRFVLRRMSERSVKDATDEIVAIWLTGLRSACATD